ncbi:MAG TPA: methylmalonyl-CoA epimerase [Thermoanaerobaculia bacterium]|nr:methylmalonyl-CoA epimerase [Thermoanaerobaculia bacterium]
MIGRIDHVGIAVRSIEEARKIYEAMGLHVEAIEDVPYDGVRVAMIPCGETRIELLEPLSEDSPVGRFLAKRGPGIHHLCLASDDVRSESDRLREGGFQVLRPEPTQGAGGCWVQFIHPKSAGGVLLELSEGTHGTHETPGEGEGHGEP